MHLEETRRELDLDFNRSIDSVPQMSKGVVLARQVVDRGRKGSGYPRMSEGGRGLGLRAPPGLAAAGSRGGLRLRRLCDCYLTGSTRVLARRAPYPLPTHRGRVHRRKLRGLLKLSLLRLRLRLVRMLMRRWRLELRGVFLRIARRARRRDEIRWPRPHGGVLDVLFSLLDAERSHPRCQAANCDVFDVPGVLVNASGNMNVRMARTERRSSVPLLEVDDRVGAQEDAAVEDTDGTGGDGRVVPWHPGRARRVHRFGIVLRAAVTR